MKSIKEHVEGYLSQRNGLIQAGISPTEALNIVSEPLTRTGLKVVLESLKTHDIDELQRRLECVPYLISNTSYSLVGILREKTGTKFMFADLELGVDTITLSADQLTDEVVSDIVNVLKSIG